MSHGILVFPSIAEAVHYGFEVDERCEDRGQLVRALVSKALPNGKRARAIVEPKHVRNDVLGTE